MPLLVMLLALWADPSPELPPARETPARLARRIGGLPRAAVEKKLSPADTASLLFKGTLGRAPAPEERDKFVRHLEKSGGVKLEVAQELTWALINTAEFAKAHAASAEEAAKLIRSITEELKKSTGR